MFDARRHHRRSIRLAGFDYRNPATYFVTMCTHNREHVFGEIRNGMMGLNENGRIVMDCIQQISHHFPGVTIDTFIAMPDHVHVLLHIDDAPSGDGPTTFTPAQTPMNIGDIPSRNGRGTACRAPTATTINDASSPLRKPTQPSLSVTTIDGAARSFGKPQPRSLSTIVGALKSAVTKRINESRGSDGTVWQRNFHEHIVRSEEECNRIRAYIRNNPRNWKCHE
jgi:putative transposase